MNKKYWVAFFLWWFICWLPYFYLIEYTNAPFWISLIFFIIAWFGGYTTIAEWYIYTKEKAILIEALNKRIERENNQ